MARSKNWRNHPLAFFDIVRALRDDPETPVEVPLSTVGKARSMTLDFNSFKQGCIEAGFELEFNHFKVGERGLWVLPSLKVVVRDDPPRMVVSVKDNSEESDSIKAALATRKSKLEGRHYCTDEVECARLGHGPLANKDGDNNG